MPTPQNTLDITCPDWYQRWATLGRLLEKLEEVYQQGVDPDTPVRFFRAGARTKHMLDFEMEVKHRDP